MQVSKSPIADASRRRLSLLLFLNLLSGLDVSPCTSGFVHYGRCVPPSVPFCSSQIYLLFLHSEALRNSADVFLSPEMQQQQLSGARASPQVLQRQ